MPVETDEGIILNKYSFSETSIVIHWLTNNSGLISTAARGVFKPKSKYFGKIDLFYYANIEFKKNIKSDLHSLNDIDLISTHDWIRTNITALHQASYCATLIERLVEKDSPIPNIFKNFLTFIESLNKQSASLISLLWFEIKLLTDFGEFPYPKEVSLNELNYIQLLANSNSPQNIEIPKKIINDINRYVLKYLPNNERLLSIRKKATNLIQC